MRPSKNNKIKNIDPGDIKIEVIPMGKTAIPLSIAHNPFNAKFTQKDDDGKRNKKKVR